MTAHNDNLALMQRLSRYGITVSEYQANILRRAALTLQKWSEQECGDDYGCTERDEVTGIPYHLSSTGARWRIPDREKGAQKRVATVCNALGIFWYFQSDPRGAPL